MKRKLSWYLLNLTQSFRIMFYQLLSTNALKGTASIIQPALMIGNGLIEFEGNVTLGDFPSLFFLSDYMHLETRAKDAYIKIGENTHINNNFVAIAEHKSIIISKRCFIRINVEIMDSDFHGIKVLIRQTSQYKYVKSVFIEDDVIFTYNLKILKVACIRIGSVIAYGSIVTSEIPSIFDASGIPVKALKVIEV